MRIQSLRLLLFTIIGFVFYVNVVGAQGSSRTIVKRLTPEDPIQISEIRVNDRVVNLDQPFDADVSWADGVRITAQNISTKTITGANILLLFPTGLHTQVAFTLRFEGLATPNSTLTFTGTPQYQKLVSFLSDRGKVPDFSRGTLLVNQAFFDDDTLWAQGTIFRRSGSGGWDVVSRPAPPAKKHHASAPRRTSVVQPAQWCIEMQEIIACDGDRPSAIVKRSL